MTTANPKILRHSLLRMTLHTEIIIDASPKRIWSVLTDFATRDVVVEELMDRSINQSINRSIVEASLVRC